MAQQYPFHLNGRNIFASTNDHVFQPVANLDIPALMDHRGIAGMKPTLSDHSRRRLRVVVIAFHHHVTTHNDLTERVAIVWNVISLFVNYTKLTRSQQFNSLTCLDHRPLRAGKDFVFRCQFANGNKGRSLRQTVCMSDYPSQLALYPLDGRRCRRSTGGPDSPARPRL